MEKSKKNHKENIWESNRTCILYCYWYASRRLLVYSENNLVHSFLNISEKELILVHHKLHIYFCCPPFSHYFPFYFYTTFWTLSVASTWPLLLCTPPIVRSLYVVVQSNRTHGTILTTAILFILSQFNRNTGTTWTCQWNLIRVTGSPLKCSQCAWQ